MKRKALYILGLSILSLSLTSCVSKKKFDELARDKSMVEREAAQLKTDKRNLEKKLPIYKTIWNGKTAN